MTAEIVNLQEVREVRQGSKLIDCVLCSEPIEGLTRRNLVEYEPYVEGAGPLHPFCYSQTYKPGNSLDFERFAYHFLGEYYSEDQGNIII